MEPEIHYVGEPAQWETFAGMIACKVIGISPDYRYVTIRITARRNRVYRHGEIHTSFFDEVHPKGSVRRSRRGPSWIIVKPYIWRVKDDRNQK